MIKRSPIFFPASKVHRASCRCRACHPPRPGESRLLRALARLLARFLQGGRP